MLLGLAGAHAVFLAVLLQEAPSNSTAAASPAAEGLRLGPFGSPYAAGPPGVPAPPDAPRFQTHIDVEATPKDVNETMARWWTHFNLQHSIYGYGMNVKTGGPPGSVDVLPLFKWLAKKAKDGKRNVKLPEPPTNETSQP